MRIAFITGHTANQKRKTGLHFWSDILINRGDDVRWVTIGLSRLSVFKDDKSPKLPPLPYNVWQMVKPGLSSFIWCPLIHPVKVGPLTPLLAPLFRLYPHQMPDDLTDELFGCDVVIAESGAGVMLVPAIRELCPDARIIYTASDRMETLRAHPVVVEAEEKALPFIDLIRVVSEKCLNDFPGHKNVRYIPQGIDKVAFDQTEQSPYTTEKNIICAGDMLFDADTVEMMALIFPEIQFHLFGQNAKLQTPTRNVTEYGEYDHARMIPYLKHANLGLAPYKPAKGGNYFAQSGLKISQYTYCKLPVVLPDLIADRPDHLIGYKYGDEASIQSAIEKALNYNSASINNAGIPGWNDVIDEILVSAGVN